MCVYSGGRLVISGTRSLLEVGSISGTRSLPGSSVSRGRGRYPGEGAGIQGERPGIQGRRHIQGGRYNPGI